MQKKNWLPGAAFVAGLGAAVIRAFELEHAFEADTGLAIAGRPVTLILAVFSVLMAAAFVIILLPGSHRGREKAYNQMLDGKYSGQYIWVNVSLVILAFSALYQGYTFWTSKTLYMLIFAALTVFTAVSSGIAARTVAAGRNMTQQSIFIIVPVFWAVFWLIVEYIRIAADPVVLDYVYGILAIIFTLLSVNGLASFHFGKISPEKVVLFCLLAIYMSAVSFFGPVLHNLFSPREGVSTLTLILQNLNYGYAMFYLFAVSHTVIDNIQIQYPDAHLKTK